MKFVYFIIHSFIECPDKDLEWFKDKKATCRKCGRVYFNFTR
jgi:hypothetical protein